MEAAICIRLLAYLLYAHNNIYIYIYWSSKPFGRVPNEPAYKWRALGRRKGGGVWPHGGGFLAYLGSTQTSGLPTLGAGAEKQ